MGKVIKMLRKIRELDNTKMLARFEHIVAARAIREYMGTKEDVALSLEVKYLEEEILNRMSMRGFSLPVQIPSKTK